MLDERLMVCLSTIAMGSLLCCVRAAGAEVAGLRLTTDRRIDTSSLPRIVEQVVKPGMTDREKAIALWKFATDYNYFYTAPYEPPGEDNFAQGVVIDPVKLLNVYGYGYCFQHRSIVEALAEAAGLEARTGGIGGHLIPEVYYDGQYHYLDSSQKAYCLTAGRRPVEASRDQVADDPLALLVRQRRPSNPFLPGAASAILPYEDRHILAGYFFLRDFYFQHRAYRTGHSMNLTLPAAGRVTWHWQGVGKWRQRAPKDVDWELKNFGHYNPYDGPHERLGSRTYANAVLRFHPDLAKAPAEFEERLVASENLLVGSGRATNRVAGRGHADLRFRLPYVLCGWPTVLEENGKPAGALVVSGRAACAAGGALRLLVSTDEGATFREVWTFAEAAQRPFAVDLTSHVDGRYAFRLRFEFDGPAGAARLEDVAVDVNAQAAQLPLPALLPGTNRITLHADDEEVIEFCRDFETRADLESAAHEVKNLGVSKRRIAPPLGETGEVTFRVAAPPGFHLTRLTVGGMMRTSSPPREGEGVEILVAAGNGYVLLPGARKDFPFRSVYTSDVPPRTEHWHYEADEPASLPTGATAAFVKYRVTQLHEGGLVMPRIVAFARRTEARFPAEGLRVTYRWRENGKPKSHEQVVKSAPFTYAIEVPQDAAVEMETLSVETVRPGLAPLGAPHPDFTRPPELHRRDFSDPEMVRNLREGLVRIRTKPELSTFIEIYRTNKHPLLRAQIIPVIAMYGSQSPPTAGGGNGRALGDSSLAEQVLLEARQDKDTTVADKAKKALVRFYAALPNEAQLAALGDTRPERRALAAEVLGRRHVPAARGPLAERLKDEAASVRRSAALALARLGDERASAVLIDLLNRPAPANDEDRSETVARLECAAALLVLQGEPGTAAIAAALKSPDRYLRHAVLEALAEWVGPRQEDLFIRLLDDPWAYIRRDAVAFLRKHGTRSCVPALTRLAEADPVPWVRSEAAAAAPFVKARVVDSAP